MTELSKVASDGLHLVVWEEQHTENVLVVCDESLIPMLAQMEAKSHNLKEEHAEAVAASLILDHCHSGSELGLQRQRREEE
jgi:hypothetical protein